MNFDLSRVFLKKSKSHGKTMALRSKLIGKKAYALVTLLERRQREHTLTVLCVPFSTTFTLRMLGLKVLLVFLLE